MMVDLKSSVRRGRRFHSSWDQALARLIPTEKAAVAILTGVAVSMVALYLWLFTWPFRLTALYDQPLVDLYQISQTRPWARWWLMAGLIGQALLYWVGWWAAQRARGRAAWGVVLGGALACSAALLWMYPLGAADLFDNILHGRILSVYGANPFRYAPQAFPDDPFLPYVAWRPIPSAYGPLWELLAGAVTWWAGDALLPNIIAFKLVSGLFLLGNGAMVALILRTYAPERALAGVVLLTWNPVVLYETIGNGHNDLAMVFWVLVATWLLLRERYTLAMLALLVGTLFKFIPVLLLPAAVLIALRALPDWRQRTHFVGITAVWAILLVGLAYLPFWFGAGTLAIERRQQLFTTSLPAFVYSLLLPTWGAGVGVPISWVAAGLALLFALIQGRLAWPDRSWLSFSQSAFNILLFYLLVSCLWFQSWYAVWPLALAALLPPGHAVRLAMLFSVVVLTKPLLFEPMWLWSKPLPPKAWRELRLGPAVFLIPWLYAAFVVWRARKKR